MHFPPASWILHQTCSWNSKDRDIFYPLEKVTFVRNLLLILPPYTFYIARKLNRVFALESINMSNDVLMLYVNLRE